MNFLDTLSTFIFDTIIYISNSVFGYGKPNVFGVHAS